MAHNNQNLVLDNIETAQFLELQPELNKDDTKRSLSQVVAYALRVAMANSKAAPNADFRDKVELFSGVYIPPSDAQKRHAISIENIRKIQAECY